MFPQPALLCPILIGREPYLHTLRERLVRARQGQGGVMLLAGEAGVGKSRLVAEAKTLALQQGFTILQGDCFEPDRTFPYAPFLDMLRSFCATHPPEELAQIFGPVHAAPLLSILPELSLYLPKIPPAPTIEPEQAKRRLFEALTHFCLRAGGLQGQVCLILEDLHWADETSLDLLLYLARRLPVRPALLLLTYRPDELSPSLERCLAELNRARLKTELALPRLSLPDTAAMVRAIFDQPQPAQIEFVNTLYALTDGNPFFVEEVLRSLVAAGEIYLGLTGWARKPLEQLHIPRTIHDSVQRRLQTLSEPARRLLTLAAVAGRRFDFILLQALTQSDEVQLVALIKELIAAQLVVEEANDVFAFRHALTRQAVLASQLTRERKRQHFHVAETMERVYADAVEARVGDLAHQFYEAEVWGKAFSYAQRAGEQAQRLYAPRTAIEHFSRALTAAHTLSASAPLPALYRARGGAYETLGDFDSARADYEQSLQTAQAVGDVRAEWHSLIALGFLWAGRDMPRTGEYFQHALALARTVNDPTLIGHSLNRLGNWQMMTEHPRTARQQHEDALALFRAQADQRGLAETLDLLGTTTLSVGENLLAADYYAQAIALFRTLNDQHGLVSALTMSALCCGQALNNVAFAGDEDRIPHCLANADEALSISRAVGWRSAEALALTVLGQALAAQGVYNRALEALHSALTIATEIEHQQWLINIHLNLGAVYAELLDFAAAYTRLEHSLQAAHAIGSLYWIRTVTGFWASTLIGLNDLSGAASALDAVPASESLPLTMGERHVWYARAELALAQNHPEQTLKIADWLVEATPTLEVHGAGGIPRLAWLKAEALRRMGDADGAEILLKTGADFAARQGTSGWHWRLQAALARLYSPQRRASEWEAAGKTIVMALAANLSDTTPTLQQNFVKQALAAFPASPRPTVRQLAKQQFGGLTTREREIAVRVAQGKSNRVIADELVVSERTVEKHIENIMAKLGFDSRVQIAAWMTSKQTEK